MAARVESQNLYGMFVDACEDATFEQVPGDDAAMWTSPTVGNKRKSREGQRTVFGKIFTAVEKMNLPMAESTDSLASSLSTNSLLSSQNDLTDVFTPELLMEAVESLTLNNYGSTNSLASQAEGLNNSQQPMQSQMAMAVPPVIQFFFRALEQFLHKSEEEGEASVDEFPKFC